MSKVSLLDVKKAILNDGRFRELFPELQEDFNAILDDPGCSCHTGKYKKVFKYKDRLKAYFPTKTIESDNIPKSIVNHWSVINCTIDELENKLKDEQIL